MAVEDVYELAYREAVRALDHQRTTASELRGRAGLLLATASIAMSLLGPTALRGGGAVTWAAVLCFVLLVACVLTMLWPGREWGFESNPKALLADLADDPAASRAAHVDLIAHLTNGWRANALHLERIARAFRLAACLLAIQIVLTVAAASAML